MIETNREFRLFWLERALKNLEALKGQAVNEEDTKRLIIEPLLAWIGYDVWKPGEVREQYPIPKRGGQSADYALMKSDQPSPYIIVEAKALGKNLDSDFEQIIDYCNYSGTRFGIITDGEKWIVLDESWKGRPAKERIILELDIEEKLDNFSGYDALLLLNPENEEKADSFFSEIKKLYEAKVSNLDKHIKTELIEALKKIKIPIGEGQLPVHPKPEGETEVAGGEEGGEWPKDLSVLMGKRPPDYVLIDGVKYETRSWASVVVVVAEWLAKRGEIKEPIKSKKLFIINDRPEQVTKMRNPGPHIKPLTNAKGFYVWTHGSASACLERCFKLLEHFGYTPGHAYLKPPADWKP
ncbi:MAG: type I restriction enzyme HsdR N-terminal domain-containing protein [candidate division WOR-3 bacterium]